MLRAVFLWLSEQPRIFGFVRKNRLARKLASRFVAGETIDEAIATVRDLNNSNLSASLDPLGESVLHVEEAQRACRSYLDLLDRIHAARANANVSVKLTQMGLDIDEQLCISNMRAIIGKAKQYDSFVRIDMEQSSYTARTLQWFKDVFYPEFGNAVGVVLQSYLRRTASDVVDMIDHAKRFVTQQGIGVERFEFQMLYGVRRDLQYRLRREGYNMRMYVPS